MQRKGMSLLVMALLMATAVVVVQAEEKTVKATSSWVGEGQFFLVKEKQALFVGAFGGILFVESKQGTLDAAKLVCPAMLEVNLDDDKQSGGGRCIITTRSGDRVYAKWACAGEHLRGCSGTFTLLGGTGKFQQITGSSDFEIRSDVAEYVANLSTETVQVTASGLAVWPALTYTLP